MDHERQIQTSEASGYRLAESLKELAVNVNCYVGYSTMTEEEVETADAHTLLNRMLSTRTHVPIASSLARKYDEAHSDPPTRSYAHIGQGQCGTVFVFRGTKEVVKLPNTPAKQAELWQDAESHGVLDKVFREAPSDLRSNISIPRYYAWIKPDMVLWWNSRVDLFPDEQKPTYGLVSERIFPVMQPVRQAIIDAFCPKQLRKAAMEDPQNKDCLVRLYLGKRDREKRSFDKSFRLRNFPLLINDMERLGLDAAVFATVMADALAIMHWSAHIDGNDVEFVLGSAPTETRYRKAVDPARLREYGPHAPEHAEADFDFTKQSIHVWLLDFNQCTQFQPSADQNEWLPLLTKAFWFNDPYYPRPVSADPADKALWVKFSERYLASSHRFTQPEGPARFIQAVEEEGKKRQEKITKAGKDSLFGALAG